MARNFASQLAMIAFATAALDGAMDGLAFSDTVRGALATGAIFYFLGLVLGETSRRLIEEHSEGILKRELEKPEVESDSETAENSDQQPIGQDFSQAA